MAAFDATAFSTGFFVGTPTPTPTPTGIVAYPLTVITAVAEPLTGEAIIVYPLWEP